MAKEIDFIIKSYYKNFSDKYRQIADYILCNNFNLNNLSIKEFAKSCHVSPSTISRFAKTLGYNSFQELKIALLDRQKTIDTYPIYHGININDSYLVMAKKIFNANSAALESTLARLTEESLNKSVELIINARILGLFGLGASGIVAKDGYHKFLRTAIPVTAPTDFHMQLMQATRLSPKDCALIISHSGENTDALELARIAKDNKVPIIAITSFGNSKLAKLSDVTLLSISEEQNFRVEALHALIAQMSIIDSLFMMISIRSGKKSEKIFTSIRKEIDRTRSLK